MKQARWIKRKKTMLSVMMSSVLLFPLTGVSHAEEQDEYSFDQVVVTATKTPQKEFDANANITVITREQIENNHYHDLAEALRNVPGVYIANYGGGVGYESSNSLRINGSDQIVVLVDGIRVNVAGVNFPASAYNSLENVERVEVLKGSASALYGSAAKGGIINIITRKVEGNKSTLTVTGGSYGKENYSFFNQGKSGDYSWVITSQKDILGDYKDAHGLTVPQHLNADTHTFKLTKKLNEASDITVSYEQYKADTMYAGSNYNLDTRQYGTEDNYNWRMIYNYKFSERVQNQLSFLKSVYDTDYDSYLTHVKTIGIQDQLTAKLGDDHVVTSGFDFNQDKVLSMNGTKLTNRAFYLQDEWNLTKRWKLTSGVRYDDNSSFGNHTTPRVNLGYKQDEKTDYYVAYSEFFITPTPYQLYSSAYGNKNLRPESGRTREAGVNHKFDDTLTANFHVFQRKADNVVGFVYTDPVNWLGHYENMDKEEAHGWDVQFNKKFSDHLNAYAGYTYTIIDPTAARARNVDGYIPRGAWNIGFDYQQDKYNIQLQGRGVIDRPGPQTSDAYADFFPANTYWVWDMAASYKVAKDVKAFVKVNNIFDKFYAEQSNARGEWYGYAGEWWTSPGRNFQVGVQYQF